MKRVLRFAPTLFGLIFSLGSLTACQTPDTLPPKVTVTAASAPLRIGLSDCAIEFGHLVDRDLPQNMSHAEIQFIQGNDRTLLEDLEEGFLDAALVYYIPDKEEHWFNPVALDGLVFIVHPDNSTLDIGLAEAKALFSGSVLDWSTIGGPELEVKLISREPGAGARIILEERLMAELPIAGSSLIAPSGESLQSIVVQEPGAIGFSTMGSAEDMKVLSIEGVTAIPANTSDQSYPLTAPLYFVSSGEPDGELRGFLAWLQSPEGQATIGEKYGQVR